MAPDQSIGAATGSRVFRARRCVHRRRQDGELRTRRVPGRGVAPTHDRTPLLSRSHASCPSACCWPGTCTARRSASIRASTPPSHVYRQDGAQKALPQFERLAREFGKAGQSRDQSRDESAALHYVGECHWRLGNFSDAHRFLDRALELERASKDRAGEARTLNVLGLLAWDEGNYDQAIAQFKAARGLAQQLGDKKTRRRHAQ